MEKMKLKMLSLMCPYTARYGEQVSLMHDKLASCCDEIAEQSVPECMPPDCKERIKSKLAAAE
ncbi:hypothetical protein [Cerasicoccus arenae]|nr:hypothetical protein [Cerasicoccus arenae]MBK1859017.1 hypothetical protein [Cerasicoccus arenae]